MPNGRHSKVSHIGSVRLTSTLTFPNVLHVPDVQFNLLSVHKLCQQLAGKVVFSSTDCTLQASMLQEVVLGKVVDGSYCVSEDNSAIIASNTKLIMQTGSKGGLQ